MNWSELQQKHTHTHPPTHTRTPVTLLTHTHTHTYPCWSLRGWVCWTEGPELLQAFLRPQEELLLTDYNPSENPRGFCSELHPQLHEQQRGFCNSEAADGWAPLSRRLLLIHLLRRCALLYGPQSLARWLAVSVCDSGSVTVLSATVVAAAAAVMWSLVRMSPTPENIKGNHLPSRCRT